MEPSFKYRLFIWIWISLFVITRIPYLSYPWFWDESWSYIPGIIHMKETGPTLLPQLADAVYTRGHPLLFYFISAIWMQLFGGSFTSMHILALLISCFTIYAVYKICEKLWNNKLAILSTILVTTQTIFLVQSTFLLPEMLVALWAIACLYYYVSKKHIASAIALTAILFTKESGLVLGVILGGYSLLNLFDNKKELKERLKRITSVALPGLLIASFFAIQKYNNGWYLFPEHTALMHNDWLLFKGKMRFCFEILFTSQGRAFIFLLLIVFSVVAATKLKKWHYVLPLLLGIVIYILIHEQFGYISRKALLPFIFGMLLWILHLFSKNKETEKAQLFLNLAGWYCVVYLVFSSFNFFTNRYILSPLIIFLLITAWVLYKVSVKAIGNKLMWPVTIVILLVNLGSYLTNRGIRDVDTGAYNAIYVQKKLMTYMVEHKMFDANIYCPSGLDLLHLTDERTGYLPKGVKFTQTTGRLDSNTQIILINNIEFDSLDAQKIAPANFALIYSVQKREAWGMIYKKNN